MIMSGASDTVWEYLSVEAVEGDLMTSRVVAVLSPLLLWCTVSVLRCKPVHTLLLPYADHVAFIIRCSNLAYGVFSIVLFLSVLHTALDLALLAHGCCGGAVVLGEGMVTSTATETAMWEERVFLRLGRVYLYSKLWENVDVILLALLPHTDALSAQFLFHHSTTPILVFSTLLVRTRSLVPAMLANKLNHIVMYLYFGQVLQGAYVRPMLVACQILQLTLVSYCASVSVLVRVGWVHGHVDVGGAMWVEMLSLFLALMYLFLFVRDLWCVKAPSPKQEETKSD
eukprot:TRINITY_DN18079_c0_g1_i1.p1 TRINITY_DN18079_c0_g1~~TRINITY_DN18079_c0_g1_i1.p1  ORF type:complete len:284 (-),score=28.18 TRINITY_DN18079_c0_g1_i1:179-1030(-)